MCLRRIKVAEKEGTAEDKNAGARWKHFRRKGCAGSDFRKERDQRAEKEFRMDE